MGKPINTSVQKTPKNRNAPRDLRAFKKGRAFYIRLYFQGIIHLQIKSNDTDSPVTESGAIQISKEPISTTHLFS